MSSPLSFLFLYFTSFPPFSPPPPPPPLTPLSLSSFLSLSLSTLPPPPPKRNEKKCLKANPKNQNPQQTKPTSPSISSLFNSLPALPPASLPPFSLYLSCEEDPSWVHQSPVFYPEKQGKGGVRRATEGTIFVQSFFYFSSSSHSHVKKNHSFSSDF